MAGYIRQSAIDIQPGVGIDSGPLNDEFNQIVLAMSGTVGHAHDGSTGNGPKLVIANAASDYITDSFTPTIIGGTAAGTGTYSVQNGKYTKIGNLVWVNIVVTWSAHTGTGNLRIGTLPFTAGATVDQAINVSQSALTYTSYIQGRVKAATTYIELTQAATNAAEAIIAIEAAGSVWITGTYTVT